LNGGKSPGNRQRGIAVTRHLGERRCRRPSIAGEERDPRDVSIENARTKKLLDSHSWRPAIRFGRSYVKKDASYRTHECDADDGQDDDQQ
jgi:hypothetical protein